MKRKNLRRFKKGEMTLDINSLLDILVILLVFLIKNYSATNVDLKIPKELTLPISKSQSVNHEGISVAIDKEYSVYFGDEKISKIKKEENGLISVLYSKLIEERKRLIKKAEERGVKFEPLINVVVDETLTYKYLRRLMFTSKEAGFKEFKFVVTQ